MSDWVVNLDVDLKKVTEKEAHDIAKKTLSNMVVVVRNQKLTEQDQLDFCAKIGNYQKSANERTKHMHLTDGILRVTGEKNEHKEEGLFGHTSALDWHANQASNYNRDPLIWLYGVKGTAGSCTSWINNIESYNALPATIKEKIKNAKITLGYKEGSYSTSKWFKTHHHKDKPFNLVHTNSAGYTGLYFPFLQVFGGLDESTFNFLRDHILQDKFRYDHYWEDGDVVISEQWLSIHKRWEFERMSERVLHRIAFDYSKVII